MQLLAVLRRWRPVALVAASALCLGACVVAPPRPYGGMVYVPPPAVQVETVGVAPGPGYFWIGGYWNWAGGRHVWVPGYWERARPGYEWVPHRWVAVQRGWRLESGHWRRR